jgi:hypothetical protein
MKLLDDQEKGRRKGVKDSLDGCMFPSWGDISAPTGQLK